MRFFLGGSHDPLARGIPDIFIPPTQNGNAGVMGGRNENSGMTMVMTRLGEGVSPCSCGGGSFRSGMQSPTGAGPARDRRGPARFFLEFWAGGGYNLVFTHPR